VASFYTIALEKKNIVEINMGQILASLCSKQQ
jgi:hypothetical protein